jgi:hypothetical protein
MIATTMASWNSGKRKMLRTGAVICLIRPMRGSWGWGGHRIS